MVYSIYSILVHNNLWTISVSIDKQFILSLQVKKHNQPILTTVKSQELIAYIIPKHQINGQMVGEAADVARAEEGMIVLFPAIFLIVHQQEIRV